MTRRPGSSFVLALVAVMAFSVAVPLAGLAMANHPPGTCIDLTPNTATNQVGEPHTITATLRTIQNNQCTGAVQTVTAVPGQTGTANVRIDFEITGPNDPDDSNTPATEDLTCTIKQGESSCVVQYTGTTAGTDTIVGFHDENNNNAIDQGEPQDTVTKTYQGVTQEPECDDGIDNDNDGFTDHPDDPNCISPNDDSEAGPDNVPEKCNVENAGNISGRIIIGSPGADIIVGTEEDDIICALGGDDAISSLGGKDIVLAGRGDDNVRAGRGKDQVRGGAGNDAVSGQRNNDIVIGGGGRDSVKGNKGIDTLRGGPGDDTLQGGEGDDILKGGRGNDNLRGWTGRDQLDGGPGTDICFGGRGRDKEVRCEK